MENIKKRVNRIFEFIKNDQIEIRIRMLFVLVYATIAACFVGTTTMLLMRQPFETIYPNIILLSLGLVGLALTKAKRYELAAVLIIIGCADVTLPVMFFAAGGNDSGMPIWFIFGVVVACMMSKGKIRFCMIFLTIALDVVCMLTGYFHPELVTPLEGVGASFFDSLWSFVIVCIGLSIIVVIHLMTYDRQRRKLEYQSRELKRLMQTDELTGLYNRRAYYDEAGKIKNSKETEYNVLIAMDVNGLKHINDTLGHAEGDALLKAAACIMQQAFSEYGKIFRVGGDEFMALLTCSDEAFESLRERLKNSIELSQKEGKAVSIAMGIVRVSELSKQDFHEIEKLADVRMYEDKSNYYQLLRNNNNC